MKVFFIIVISIVLFGCSKNESTSNDATGEWAVNEWEVTGQFNLFPLAQDPEFTSVNNIDISDQDLVGIVNFGAELRVYPYVYVNQSEIINDVYNGQKFAFSYCPITRSAIAFKTTGIFRASGYLYRDNLTPWDEETESIWSQMLLKGIRGPKKNQEFNTIPVLETNFGTVKNFFPNARVAVFESIINNRTSVPPDGNDSNDDDTPGNGVLVHGILDKSQGVHILNYNDFSTPTLVNITIDSQDYVVYGDQSRHIINAFKVSDFENYQILEDEFPFVMKDNSGVKFDVFGKGTNGTMLESPKSAYTAIWRAWEDIFDNFTFH